MLKIHLSTWRQSVHRRVPGGVPRTLATSTAGAAAGPKPVRAQLVNGRAMATEILDEVGRSHGKSVVGNTLLTIFNLVCTEIFVDLKAMSLTCVVFWGLSVL